MKNIACIIARTNSKRLPKKALLDVGGKKTIEHIIDSMKELENVDKVYVCTSIDENDQILLKIARDNGIDAYAGSKASVIDRMLEVAEREEADNLLRVTGDNIFTDPIILEYALEEHVKNDADYTRVENLPLGVTGEIMKVSALKDCYQRIDPSKSGYLALYMFNPKIYKCVTVMPPHNFNLPYCTLTVDTPEDWERTQFIFDNIPNTKIYFGDIWELSQEKEIPYYIISSDSQIKLPDNETISFGEFRKVYEKKILESISVEMKATYYDKERKKR